MGEKDPKAINPLARTNAPGQKLLDTANTHVTTAGGVDAALKTSGGGLPSWLGPVGAILGGVGLAQDAADISEDGANTTNVTNAATNGAGLRSWILGAGAGTAGSGALLGAGITAGGTTAGAATMGGIIGAGVGATAAAGSMVLAAGAAGASDRAGPRSS